jgi:hypothetical protein
MTPDTFEDRLLAELRQVVAARPAPTHPASAAARRSPRARLLAGAAAAAAVAAVAVVVAGGGDPAAPAYAVSRQADGDVSVSISSLSDADGLEGKLRAAGIPAVVDYTPAGKMCREPRGKPARAAGQGKTAVRMQDRGPATFTIPRDTVRDGQTVVIQTSGGDGVSSLGMAIVEGNVASCELVDAPSVPADPSFSTGGGPERGVAAGGGSPKSLHTGP